MTNTDLTSQQKEQLALAVEKFGQEKIDALTKKHGQLSVIIVEDKMGLFKKPDRKVISSASAVAATDPIEYVAIIAENCFVEGDKELLQEDDYFLGIVPVINQLVETKTASLLKL